MLRHRHVGVDPAAPALGQDQAWKVEVVPIRNQVRVRIEQAGYKSWRKDIEPNSTTDLGVIVLEPE